MPCEPMSPGTCSQSDPNAIRYTTPSARRNTKRVRRSLPVRAALMAVAASRSWASREHQLDLVLGRDAAIAHERLPAGVHAQALEGGLDERRLEHAFPLLQILIVVLVLVLVVELGLDREAQ